MKSNKQGALVVQWMSGWKWQRMSEMLNKPFHAVQLLRRRVGHTCPNYRRNSLDTTHRTPSTKPTPSSPATRDLKKLQWRQMILIFKLCENHLISLNSGVFAAQGKLGLESDVSQICSVWHNNLMSCSVIVNKANSDLLICNNNWQYAGLGLWT